MRPFRFGSAVAVLKYSALGPSRGGTTTRARRDLRHSAPAPMAARTASPAPASAPAARDPDALGAPALGKGDDAPRVPGAPAGAGEPAPDDAGSDDAGARSPPTPSARSPPRCSPNAAASSSPPSSPGTPDEPHSDVRDRHDHHHHHHDDDARGRHHLGAASSRAGGKPEEPDDDRLLRRRPRDDSPPGGPAADRGREQLLVDPLQHLELPRPHEHNAEREQNPQREAPVHGGRAAHFACAWQQRLANALDFGSSSAAVRAVGKGCGQSSRPSRAGGPTPPLPPAGTAADLRAAAKHGDEERNKHTGTTTKKLRKTEGKRSQIQPSITPAKRDWEKEGTAHQTTSCVRKCSIHIPSKLDGPQRSLRGGRRRSLPHPYTTKPKSSASTPTMARSRAKRGKIDHGQWDV